MKRGTDYVAWSLQFVLGLGVGAVMGWLVLSRLFSVFAGRGALLRMSGANLALYLLGAGLIGGGLASRYGDRLWVGPSYRIIPPDEPAQSKTSRAASLVAGIGGGVVALAALLRHCGAC